jgi:hypothetical protein
MSRTSIVLIVAKISDVSLYTNFSIRKFYEIAARAQLVSWLMCACVVACSHLVLFVSKFATA